MTQLELLKRLYADLYEQYTTQTTITKAFNPIGKSFTLVKAWVAEDGTVYREGWLSTNDQDQEKDITEPEAFAPALDDYFFRGAPLSSNHDQRGYPVGHVQKGALVRDGQIFQEAAHPTDPADFEHFTGDGTGFYGRIAVTEPQAARAVIKGNMRSFSFIANARKYERLPNGGRRFLEFDPLIETTIAAYPVNTSAVMTVAKAFLPEETNNMDLETLLRQTAERIAAEEAAVQKAQPAPAVTLEDLGKLFQQQQVAILSAVDEKVSKAFTDREGTGRLGQTTPPADSRDADPAAYLVKKANSGEELDPIDKDLIARLTLTYISQGMLDE